MRWKSETFDEKRARLATWRPCFAWRPIKVDDEWVWLEWIFKRKVIQHGALGDIYIEIQYADAMSILRKREAMEHYDGLE